MLDATYLITDPFGVGEQLILQLIDQGQSVFTIYPTPKEVPMSFLGKVHLKYGFLKFDQEKDFTRVLPRRVKYVIHLYNMYSGPFTTMFRANPCATLSLLDWARKAQVEKFVYVSSGEVYGQGSGIDEGAPYNPHSFYATTKFETEYLFRYYHTSLRISTLRLFFPFGARVKNGLITDLKEAIVQERTFQTDYATISPTFVNDVVDVINALIQQKTDDVYNVCGCPVDIKDLAGKIATIIGKELKEIKVGKTVLTGSNVKAINSLGFKETPLDEALRQSYQK
jgi:UDP-glucose 4-epimerase